MTPARPWAGALRNTNRLQEREYCESGEWQLLFDATGSNGSVSNRRELRLDGEELTLKLSSLEVAAPGVYCGCSPCRVL